MSDPEIHEEVENLVVDDSFDGPPHAHKVDQTLQYLILVPALLGFLAIGWLAINTLTVVTELLFVINYYYHSTSYSYNNTPSSQLYTYTMALYMYNVVVLPFSFLN